MSIQEKELIREVQFKTIFRVYICLLKRKEASSKEIQRALLFTTPAQAKYHLKRLAEMGLANQMENGEFGVTGRKFGILRFFFKIRNRIIPMSLFYALFFALSTVLLYIRASTPEILLLGALITVKEVVDSYSYFSML